MAPNIKMDERGERVAETYFGLAQRKRKSILVGKNEYSQWQNNSH